MVRHSGNAACACRSMGSAAKASDVFIITVVRNEKKMVQFLEFGDSRLGWGEDQGIDTRPLKSNRLFGPNKLSHFHTLPRSIHLCGIIQPHHNRTPGSSTLFGLPFSHHPLFNPWNPFSSPISFRSKIHVSAQGPAEH